MTKRSWTGIMRNIVLTRSICFCAARVPRVCREDESEDGRGVGREVVDAPARTRAGASPLTATRRLWKEDVRALMADIVNEVDKS